MANVGEDAAADGGTGGGAGGGGPAAPAVCGPAVPRVAPVMSTSPGYPGPAWPPLEPAVRVPCETARGGQFFQPQVIFDGPRLVVIEQYEPFWSVGTAVWYAPTVLTLALAVAAAWLLLAVRRVLRQPRESGRWYCRRCNYDLTPATPPTAAEGEREAGGLTRAYVRAHAAAVCPECGRPPGRRGPARGRPGLLRIGVPGLLVALGVLGGAPVYWFTLQASSPTRYGAPWLPPVATGLLGWGDWVHPDPDYGSMRQRVRVWDVDAGREVLRVSLREAWGQYRVIDGRLLVGVAARWTTPGAVLSVVDLATGAVRQSPLPGGASGSLVTLPPADGRVLVHAVPGSITVPAPPARATATATLWSVDPETAAFTRVAAVEYPLSTPGPGLAAYAAPRPTVFMVAPPGREPAWALGVADVRWGVANQTEAPWDWHIPDGPGGGTRVVRATMAFSTLNPEGFHTFDGRAVRLQSNKDRSTHELDLSTGAVTITPRTGPWTAGGSDDLLRLEYPAYPPRLVDRTGRVVAVPTVGKVAVLPGLSPDGAWAWSAQQFGGGPTGWAGYLSPAAPELVAWDLRPLRARLAREEAERAAGAGVAGPPATGR